MMGRSLSTLASSLYDRSQYDRIVQRHFEGVEPRHQRVVDYGEELGDHAIDDLLLRYLLAEEIGFGEQVPFQARCLYPLLPDHLQVGGKGCEPGGVGKSPLLQEGRGFAPGSGLRGRSPEPFPGAPSASSAGSRCRSWLRKAGSARLRAGGRVRSTLRSTKKPGSCAPTRAPRGDRQSGGRSSPCRCGQPVRRLRWAGPATIPRRQDRMLRQPRPPSGHRGSGPKTCS